MRFLPLLLSLGFIPWVVVQSQNTNGGMPLAPEATAELAGLVDPLERPLVMGNINVGAEAVPSELYGGMETTTPTPDQTYNNWRNLTLSQVVPDTYTNPIQQASQQEAELAASGAPQLQKTQAQGTLLGLYADAVMEADTEDGELFGGQIPRVYKRKINALSRLYLANVAAIEAEIQTLSESAQTAAAQEAVRSLQIMNKVHQADTRLSEAQKHQQVWEDFMGLLQQDQVGAMTWYTQQAGQIGFTPQQIHTNITHALNQRQATGNRNSPIGPQSTRTPSGKKPSGNLRRGQASSNGLVPFSPPAQKPTGRGSIGSSGNAAHSTPTHSPAHPAAVPFSSATHTSGTASRRSSPSQQVTRGSTQPTHYVPPATVVTRPIASTRSVSINSRPTTPPRSAPTRPSSRGGMARTSSGTTHK